MHPKDDLLRAYIDRELPEDQVHLVHDHLHRCENCQSRLSRLEKNASTTLNRLDVLAPGPREAAPSAYRAYNNFRQSRKEPVLSMFKKRTFAMTIALVAILAVALSFPTVRAWAGDFLALFRVQEVAVITFDPAEVEQALSNFEDNQEVLEQLFKENMKVNDLGDMQAVGDAQEAAQNAGFNPRLLNIDEEVQLLVKPGMVADFTIDQPTMQALSDAAGIDVQIPEDMNGKTVTLEVPSAVIAIYGGCQVAGEGVENVLEGCTTLAQLPSPTVNAPEGLDLPRFGQAMLQILGYSEFEARAISNSIDWTSTLVLPIPTGEGITPAEVMVDGVKGHFIVQEDSRKYVLVWVKGDMLYLLQGEGNHEDAQAVVSTLD